MAVTTLELRNRSIPNKWEYIVPSLAVISLIVSCVIMSSKRFFWNDELMAYYFFSDRSFKHMMVAFRDTINTGPPLYFTLGWLWARAFGPTELSLRLFSCLGMCIACVTVWIALRRTYNFWSASIGTLALFCVSDLLLLQNEEARNYGLFAAACALGLWQFGIISQKKDYSWRTALSIIAIHAAIVLIHLFGILYSGVILLAFLLRDRYVGIFRPKIYLSIVGSWLLLIPYLPTFLVQVEDDKPPSWIPTPILHDLIGFFDLAVLFPFAILLLILTSVVQMVSSRDNRHLPAPEERVSDSKAEISLLILACSFLTVPVFVWIFSRVIRPVFVPRYMIPSLFGWSILLAYLSSRIISPTPFFTKGNAGGTTRNVIPLLVLLALFLIHPINAAKHQLKELLPGSNDDKYGCEQLPIVAQFSHDFVKRFHYSPQRHRYYFVLDWANALQFAPIECKNLDALKRNYPELFGNNIVQNEDFLKTHSRFLVLTNARGWLETRIMTDPHYKITPLGPIVDFDGREPGDRKLSLVERTTYSNL